MVKKIPIWGFFYAKTPKKIQNKVVLHKFFDKTLDF